LIVTGDFGKAEIVIAGYTDGATAVVRFGLLLSGFPFIACQQLVMKAGGVMAGQAIAGNMLVYRQE
jgi:hypothetical protein